MREANLLLSESESPLLSSDLLPFQCPILSVSIR